MSARIAEPTIRSILATGESVISLFEDTQNGLEFQKYVLEHRNTQEIYAHMDVLVQLFNKQIEEAFVTRTIRGIRKLCTQDGYKQIQKKFGAWRRRKITQLEMDQYNFLTFNRSREEPEKCVVFTLEQWLVHYDDGRVISAPPKVFAYHLIQESGAWFVDLIDTYISEK